MAQGFIRDVGQSIQTGSIINAAQITGNTSGATALISSGTMVLVGGTNVTLSQNANSITISAGGGAGVVSLNGSSGSLTIIAGNNISLSNDASTISVINLLTSASQVNDVGSATNAGTRYSSHALADHVHRGVFQVQISGNTSNSSSPVYGSVVIAGGNNVTLSQVTGGGVATITISAANQTVQPAVGSLNASSGALTIVAGNNISISNNASTISVINILTSGGGVQDVGSITQSGTGASLFARHDHVHRGLFQAQISGNTSNTSSPIYGSIVLAGGNNITLSQVSAAGAATITISAGGAGAGGIALSASNSLFTSGTVLLTGSGDVTVTVSGANQTVIFSAPVVPKAAIIAGNTSGATASMSSGTITLAGGNNITLSQNANAVTISGPNTHAQQTGISGFGGSNTTYTTGTVILSAQTNITINSSVDGASQYLRLSVADPGAGGGVQIVASNTTYNTGSVIFSAQTNITVGTSVDGASQYVRLSVADPGAGGAPTITYWDNVGLAPTQGAIGTKATQQNTLWVFPLDVADRMFPGNMTVSTAMFNVSVTASGSSSTAARTYIMRFGVYTRNGTNLSLVNSIAKTIQAAAAAGNSASWHGIRWITVHSSEWSSQPAFSANIPYYGAFMLSSAGSAMGTMNIYGNFAYTAGVARSGTWGAASSSATSLGWSPFLGQYGTTTGAMPNPIPYTAILKTVSSHNFIPHMVFNNLTGVI